MTTSPVVAAKRGEVQRTCLVQMICRVDGSAQSLTSMSEPHLVVKQYARYSGDFVNYFRLSASGMEA
jgi:hypothetical protein